MNFKRPVMRWTIIAATAVVAMGIVGGLPTVETTTQAAPLQQTPTCSWKNVGNSSSQAWGGTSAYNANAAMPASNPKMYIYSGADQANKLSNRIEEITMSGTTTAPATTSTTLSKGAKDTFGAACAFRDKGDSAMSAVYCLGGTDNPEEDNGGKGENYIQRFLTKAGTWEQNVTVSGSFQARYGAQAEYDPAHDVIWVTGGINNCSWLDSSDGSGCSASSMATGFLSFDDTAGTIKWETIGNPLSVYGHSMVYDSMGKRMIILGGSSNGKDGKSDLKALNLSNADPKLATMGNLSATGTGPSVFYHAAAYDPNLNAMVTYGGVTRNYFRNNESTENRTMLLMLGGASPAWQNQPGASLQDRVGGSMEYDTKQKVAVFTLGRKAWSSATVTGEAPTIVRTTNALTCSVPVPTTPPPATNTPIPGTPATATNTPTGPVATPTIGVGQVCPNITNRVPAAVINAALANEASVSGYGQLCNPNVPPSQFNTLRKWLTLQNNGLPFHPVFNGVIWSCGCP